MQPRGSESPPTKRSKVVADAQDFQIKSILPNEFLQTSLVTVYSTEIKQKQRISHLMQELSKHLPLITLQHLKRVRENEIIICRKTDVDEGLTLKEFLSKTPLSEDVQGIILENVVEVEVPASACKLRWQYDLMRTKWPCKFHPDKYLEALYDGTFFTESQNSFHKLMINLVLDLSHNLESQRPCGLCVDPRTDTIVSIAASRTELNPLYHCAIVMVDYVARTQNPSVLNEQYKEEFSEEIGGKCQKTCAGLLQKYSNYIKQNDRYKMLKIGAEPVNLKKKLAIENEFEARLDNLTKYGPYLCTGYDVYLTEEPCLMCSMALVHSRVRRVFFIRQSIANGALLTNFQLHAVKELNHHYEVFQCCAN